MGLASKLCEGLAKRLVGYGITRDDGDPYLDRYFLLGNRATKWAVFLHHIRASDSATEVHNHPWNAVSLILAGGYHEDRLDMYGRLRRRRVRPGSLNVIWHDTWHRIDIADEGAWTVFMRFGKKHSWGFKDPISGKEFHWTEREAAMRASLRADAEMGNRR